MASYDADDVAVRRSAEANFTAFGPATFCLVHRSCLPTFQILEICGRVCG